ncbi:RNA 2'-phosphotransferase [Wielerella bovis]|uniref:RNA 2'-phosphotransferase n=1 Tax=Wielerella bovis TaxID=2917790 RepID=UPI0020196186|nr:RNA 2'-phosphotransferase [Wielerella bovis]ULJ62904.1 RNA 2'-phosphotransferase [Wielerella bovis]
MNKLTETSKFLSYILRHHPESIGIMLNQDGWVDIDILLAQAQRHGRHISRSLLIEVVETNNKKRFTISEDGKQIRAAQGHSTKQVNIQHQAVQPPDVLYHGTATRFLQSIWAQGLISGSRHHVHLSADVATAKVVGMRHGVPVILRVNAVAMCEAGHEFYLSDNGVWLTEKVPPKFLQRLDSKQ